MFYCISSVGAVSSTENNNINLSELCLTGYTLEDYDSLGKLILKQHYSSRELITSFSVDEYINPDISSYIKKKLELHQFAIKENQIKYSYFDINIESICHNINSNFLNIEYSIKVKLKDTQIKDFTEYGERVILTFEIKNDGITISDWYTYDAIDQILRNESYNHTTQLSSTSKFKISEINLTIFDDFEEKISSFNENSINNLYSDLQTKPADLTNATSSTLTSFNRTTMVNYSMYNCSNEKQYQGSLQIPEYFDFSVFEGNWDCTNFASNVLLSGGAPVYNNNNRDTGWYYVNNGQNRSYSWSSVERFYSFIINNKTKGPTGRHLSHYTLPLPLNSIPEAYRFQEGDLVQIKYGPGGYGYPNFGHTTIITGFATKGTGILEPLVTSRSAVGSFTRNQRLSLAYAGYEYRVIKLLGYYK